MLVNYTISFTLISVFGSFQQTFFVNTNSKFHNKSFCFRIENIYIVLFFSFIITAFLFISFSYIAILSFITFILIISFQAFQLSANVNNQFRFIFISDLLLLINILVIVSFVYINDMFSFQGRYIIHLFPFLIVFVFVLKHSHIYDSNIKKNYLHRYLIRGLFLMPYAGLQWSLVQGDKYFIKFFNLNYDVNKIFILTNIMQILLLFGLTFQKAFKYFFKIELKTGRKYKIISACIIYNILSLIILSILYYIYPLYCQYYSIIKLNSYFFIYYASLYLIINNIYFAFNIIVFLEIDLLFNKILSIFIFSLLAVCIIYLQFFNYYVFEALPFMLCLSFIFSFILSTVKHKKIHEK